MSGEIEKSDDAVIVRKQAAWSKLAEVVHVKQNQLEAASSKAISELIHAKTKEDIVGAEKYITNAKVVTKQLNDARSPITTKLIEVCDRLRQPEKMLLEAIKYAETPLIEVKKAVQVERDKVQAKTQAIATFKAECEQAISQANLDVQNTIIGLVSEAVTAALEADTKADEIDNYIDFFVRENLEKLIVQVTRPESTLLNEAETTEIIGSVKDRITSAIEFNELLTDKLKTAFADYEVLLLNKGEAKKRIADEAEKAAPTAKLEADNAATAAKIAAVATAEVGVSPQDGKKLRTVYEIDMEETVASAVAILGAFVANPELCLPKLRVNKWFAFTPKQAGIALAKVKNDDPSFQPVGLVFKEVSKL